MGDPTGIGAAIIGVIGGAYGGLGLVCLGFALWLPTTTLSKVISGLLVVAALIGVPTALVKQQQRELKEQRDAVQAACSTSNLVTNEMSPASGFYAGSKALVLVYGERARDQLRDDPSLGDVANYLVERKMSFLELESPTGTSALRRDLGWEHSPEAQSPYLRLSVAQAGAPECAATARWAAQYPSQKLPALRRRGLMSEHCIAVEGVHELRSRYRVTARVTPAVVRQGSHYGLWEHALEVRDTEMGSTAATFRLFISRDGYGNHWIGCNKADAARRFERIVPISPDPRLVQLREVKDEEPVDFAVGANATPEDIAEIGKLGDLERINSTNIISGDGMVWFENNYKATDASGSFTHRGYFLTMVVDGELRKTLVRIQGKNMGWVTGLQVTDAHIRFVARTDPNSSSWLLEYSRKGAPVRALALTQDQVESLKRE